MKTNPGVKKKEFALDAMVEARWYDCGVTKLYSVEQ